MSDFLHNIYPPPLPRLVAVHKHILYIIIIIYYIYSSRFIWLELFVLIQRHCAPFAPYSATNRNKLVKKYALTKKCITYKAGGVMRFRLIPVAVADACNRGVEFMPEGDELAILSSRNFCLASSSFNLHFIESKLSLMFLS